MKKFVLVDGYVSMDNAKIKIELKKFKDIKSQLIFLLVFSAFAYDKFVDYQTKGYPNGIYDNFKVALIFIALAVILFSTYHFIFKKNHKKSININEIKSIESSEDINNEYVIELEIKKDNNRIQNLKFRKLENQLEPFLSELKKRNSRIIIK